MDIRDQINYYLNTAFKQGIELDPKAGHSLILLAEWSRKYGFVKKDSALYEDVVVPCPVIAIVEEKIREDNLTLTITGSVAELSGTETFSQIGREITKDVYTTSETTIEAEFEVQRLTREKATFLITGLENKIYEITSITANVEVLERGGRISFYGLASTGSKILWLIGMYKTHNMIKEIINGIWSAPTECPFCSGSGDDPDNPGDDCPQCDSYGYSGYNATKGISIDKGYDVRLTREKFDEYPISATDDAKVWKFVNKVWTQKWWVTPTVSEIKRLFAHFYNVREDDIYITERHHFSMPHWDIDLPIESEKGSPFDIGDIELMKYIAESVTPAGVNVFVGFYTVTYLGNLDGLECEIDTRVGDRIITKKLLCSSIEQNYGPIQRGRFRFWNGWNEAVDNFEAVGVSGIWTTDGTVDIFEPNDRFRHVARIAGDDSSMTYDVSGGMSSGSIEFWIHPETSDIRCSLIDVSGLTGFYVEYDQFVTGFTDHFNMFRKICPENESHVRIYVNTVSNQWKCYIDRILRGSGVYVSGNIYEVKFHNTTAGTGYIDCFGITTASGYTVNKNWQDIYPFGWGLNHSDCLSGVANLYEDFFRWDRPFNINVSGVC